MAEQNNSKRSDRGQWTWRRDFFNAYRSPLSRKLTVTVFIAILLVETAILLPSYLRQDSVLQSQLQDVARQWIESATTAFGSDVSLYEWAGHVINSPHIVGLAAVGENGDVLLRMGEETEAIHLASNPAPNAAVRTRDGRRLEVVWRGASVPPGVTLISRLNSAHIDQELRDYVLRIGGLVLIISGVLTLTTLIAMGDLVLKPLINLRAALRDEWYGDTDGDAGKVFQRKDEIGDVYRTTRQLLEELTEVRDDLERRVAERTTEMDILNRQLKASELRFRDFAGAASDWFWEMDKDLRFSYFSERFTAVTGVPETVLLGVTREENGNPGAAPEDWQQHLEDLHAHRAFKNFEHPRTKPDGTEVWLTISGAPVFEDGIFKGYRGTGTDFTHRRAIERELLQTKEHAERANRAKSEFLANMSHELRTPLNAILGFSEIMAEEVMGPQENSSYKEYSADIRSSALHLLDVINDILDISKIEANELILEESDTDVAEVIQDSVRFVMPHANTNDLQINIRLHANRPCMRADKRMLKQILINILSNAVKFSPGGGEITVGCRVDPDRAIAIDVTDTGIGIAQSDIPRIVDPFTQVRLNAQLASEGTGLGLALVKKLTELHGGDLRIRSQIGEGTTVTVRFPPERTIS